MKKYLISVFLILTVTLTSCDYFENSDTLNTASLEVKLTGLPAIPDTMTFVCWYAQDNTKFKPIKAFNLDADANGEINFKSEQPLSYLTNAQVLKITVDRKAAVNDSNFAFGSARVILSGRIKDGNCVFDVGEKADQMNNISAVFTLSTPTNGPGTDELSGVWFIDSLLTAAVPVAGLKLPVLYSGWRYEGWVEINGTYVSTGRFTNPKAADLFKGYSSTSAGYSFPGEDFLLNAPAGLTFPTDLSGKNVFISLEWNNGKTSGSTPSKILFSAAIPNSAQSGVSYTMQRQNNLVPNGTGVIKVDLFE